MIGTAPDGVGRWERGRLEEGSVPQQTIATGPDAGTLAGTREDGDLHRWTVVDVLSPDGMQEVRSPNSDSVEEWLSP
jgi:hypothetical protein